MYNQIAIQPQHIKSCNPSPTHHPVGVGLHARPRGLSGHLTLTTFGFNLLSTRAEGFVITGEVDKYYIFLGELHRATISTFSSRCVGRNLWICAIHGLRRSTDCAQQMHARRLGLAVANFSRFLPTILHVHRANMSTFIAKVSPVTGKADWIVQDDNYDFHQEVARWVRR